MSVRRGQQLFCHPHTASRKSTLFGPHVHLGHLGIWAAKSLVLKMLSEDGSLTNLMSIDYPATKA